MKTTIDIRAVPEDVRAHTANEAATRDVSLNDLVVEIVARHYGISYAASGYPYVGGGESNHWNLRLPDVVADALRAHANAIGGTMTGCLLLALQRHYRLPETNPRRRVNQPGVDPEILAEARRRKEAGESVRSLALELGVKRGKLTKALKGGVAA
jgi:hypothetical protein